MDSLPPDRRPNLLGIGAAKTGTTWLATVLGAHPDIFVHPQKELNALSYGNLAERMEEYADYFNEGRGAKVRCDFSVRYLVSDGALEAAARLCPGAKLLLVVRNPVDQVQSHYWHLRRQNFHQPQPVTPAPDLFEALERYPVLLKEPALYGKHAARWLTKFPRERLMIIDNDDLRRDLPATLARICEFLEVAPFDFTDVAAKTSAQDGRAGVSPRGGLLGRIFPRLYVAVAGGPYMWLKKTIGVAGAEKVKRALRLRQVSESVFFQQGYPRLDAPDRARLFEIFRKDIEALTPLAPFAARWTP